MTQSFEDSLEVTKTNTQNIKEGNSSSPLFLTLTAKCSPINQMTKRHRICDIKQKVKQYFDRNNIEIFNFETESPDDCVRKNKNQKRGLKVKCFVVLF